MIISEASANFALSRRIGGTIPLSTERIANRPLSGGELKARILADVQRVLDSDGMFVDYLAYGEVGYRVSIEMRLTNPFMPKHLATVSSGTMEGGDPDEIPDDNFVGLELNREITSPNAERIDLGIPLKVFSPSGKTTEISYDKDILENRVEPEVKDISENIRKKYARKR